MNDTRDDPLYDCAQPSGADRFDDDLGLSVMVEALLFVADRPLTVDELAEVTGAPAAHVSESMTRLQDTYADRGIVLIKHADGYRMVSSPRAAVFCRRLLGLETRSRLSRAALETLGIIAYRQPVTRSEIESIRGVDADSALATLLARGLVEEAGRLDTPGRPVLFGTSDLFLAYFGIPSLTALPELDLPEPGHGAGPSNSTDGD